ncbi:7752_t:CDS:1, partial [Acaulospora morrowiae]
HKEKNYKAAWECFDGHAKLGHKFAKYWKGYYLMSGYHVKKNSSEALRYFKMAADEGVPDAQLRYAFLLLEQEDYDVETVISYITQAADEGNATALYNLGDIYLHGKLGRAMDKDKAIELIKLAALKKQPKAMEALTRLSVVT